MSQNITTETPTNVESLKVPADTLIHIGGMPFHLSYETSVLGSRWNLDYGLKALEEKSSASGDQEQSGPATP